MADQTRITDRRASSIPDPAPSAFLAAIRATIALNYDDWEPSPSMSAAEAILALPEMQQIRELIAALYECRRIENMPGVSRGEVDGAWMLLDQNLRALSGCVREWATTPDKEAQQ